MKIEDTPFQFSGAAAPDKLRPHNPFTASGFEDLDLSFLELLNTVAGKPVAAAPEDTVLSLRQARDRANAEEGNASAEKPGRPKLNLIKPTEPITQAAEEATTQVEKDMALLQSELSPIDIQYLKQSVIPGLPILMGSVPIESIFPRENGQFSYRGHDISPKLADLIEKGYKTGRPIRVDLDPKSAVVLKIRNGQVSAEFVSSDRTMSLVMQQELDDLRHRMALKNLPVGNLEAKYQDPRQSRQDQDRQAHREEE